jgi:peptidoglycan hydrolase-like protein with peptidoglycan-binding domain
MGGHGVIGKGVWYWVGIWAQGMFIAALVCFMALPAQGQDENTAFIQLEALPDAPTALARAGSYAQNLGADGDLVKGFHLGQTWHVVVLGPLAADQAAGKMAALKAAGKIPQDAFITDGAKHAQMFWPIGPDTQAPAITNDPAPPEETLAQAQQGEAQLSRDEKAQIQQALQWYGHYAGAVDGAFGRGSRAAMAQWQAQTGFAATGVLTNLQRETLIANYRADTAAYGFAPVTDAEAGVAFTLPAALLQFERYEPPFVHYAAKDGSALRLAIISEPGDAPQLAMLYDMLQTLQVVPPNGARSIEGDRFTINAQSDTVDSFATASASKGAIKGYLLTSAPDQADQAQRILAMLAATFRSTGGQVLDPGLVPLEASIKAGVLAGMAQIAPLGQLSGIYVSDQGHVLTKASAVQGCGKITIDGGITAQITHQSAPLDTALLRPDSAVAPRAVAQIGGATAPISAGAKVLLAGYPLPMGLPAPVLSGGTVTATTGPAGQSGVFTLTAPVTPLDQGGPVLDMAAGLQGMILGNELDGKILPKGMAVARDMGQIGPWLAASLGPDLPARQPQGDRVTDLTPDARNAVAMAITVQVLCWP